MTKPRKAPKSQSQDFDGRISREISSAFRLAAERGPIDDTSDAAIAEAYQTALVESADEIVKSIVKAAPRRLREARQARRGFEGRLARVWRPGLQALDQLRMVYAEYGEEYYKSGFAQRSIRHSALFRASAALHGRSCRVALEIQTLLEAGLPDGALARWRTLHEIAIVALLIAQEGEEAARGYLDHEVVQRHRLMMAHVNHAAALKFEPVAAADRKPLETAFEEILAARGKGFLSDYGWAAGVTAKKRPTFADLESRVKLERFRPYYSWASGGIHAGSHGLVALGAHFRFGGPMAAGATNRGLVDPGQNTAISLSQILAALMVCRPTPFFTLSAIVIGKLAKRCQDGFVRAHEVVERRTEANLSRRRSPPKAKQRQAGGPRAG